VQHKRQLVAAAIDNSRRGDFEVERVWQRIGEAANGRLRRVWFDPVNANNRKETSPDAF
jgi:hypothetical protein